MNLFLFGVWEARYESDMNFSVNCFGSVNFFGWAANRNKLLVFIYDMKLILTKKCKKSVGASQIEIRMR